MKKIYSLALLSLIFLFSANAQTVYEDDFESYTIGEGIALQNDVWSTWSVAPGSAEDPVISETYALSGTKSVKVSGTNDGFVQLNNLTSGRYRVEFNMLIPQGRQGYYNILQQYNGANSKWGIQIFFKNQVGTIDGGGQSAATFPYTNGQWFKIQQFVDLDNDWVDFYIDDVLIHAYQWSKGCFNQAGGVVSIDAINFYAWDENGTPEFYVDDIIIEQVEMPEAPQNLTAVENDGDINISWEEPETTLSVESYLVVRDGFTIATLPGDELSYIDEYLYPQTYSYEVKAFYGVAVGASAPAGPVTVTVPGGNQREFVVFELFTGTWCPYCPRATQALDMLNNDGLDIAILEFHAGNGDVFETPASNARMAYYEPFYDEDDPGFGFPATIINGMDGFEGALTSAALMKQYYKEFYDEYMAIPTVFTIDTDVEIVATNPYEYNISIDVTETFHYYNDQMKLFVFLTETDIPYSWQGQSKVNFVVRAMFPTVNGINLDFSIEDTDSNVVNVMVDNQYELENCEVIIYVQNTANAHIMEAKRIKLSEWVGLQETLETKISVFPNPSNDIIKLRAGEEIQEVRVSNIAGQEIFKSNINSNSFDISVDSWAKGLYMIQLKTNSGISTHKISVN